MPNRNPLEKEVKADIVKWLNSQPNIWAWVRPVGLMKWKTKQGKMRYAKVGQEGQSDVEGIVRKNLRVLKESNSVSSVTMFVEDQEVGVHLEVETKRKGETPTDKQAAYLLACKASGAIAVWADSVAMLEYKLQREFKERGWSWPPS